MLGIDGRQIPGGDTGHGVPRFPLLASDLDVNRTMNLV